MHLKRPTTISRRQFLTAFAPASAAPTLDAALTPATVFFRHYTHATPQINADYWSFSVGGNVRHPLTWSYDDILGRPQIERLCTLVCASHEPGGERIGHAVWRGVPLATLLDEIEVPSEAVFARLEAAGGGRTVVTVGALRDGLLATHMNDAPLRPEQGFPARLILPGLYEHKQPRWIERVELWDSPGPGGWWERRGWTASEVRMVSAFDAPRTLVADEPNVLLTGYAFAGTWRIATVEVSVDGGAWVGVALGPSVPNVWTRWQVAWPAPAPGTYQFRVRATDERGVTQTDDAAGPFPDGCGRLHAITVRVPGATFS